MSLRRCFIMLKYRKRVVLITVIVFVYLIYAVLYLMYADIISDEAFLEINTCPACYGVDKCDDFKARRFVWDGYWLPQVMNVKNVYFVKAPTNGHAQSKYILKKLGHADELEELDQKMCSFANRTKNCNLSNLNVRYLDPGKDTFLQAITGLSDLSHCPSARLVDLMVEKCSVKDLNQDVDVKTGLDKSDLGVHLLTILSVNPEPLIIQMFPKQEGWPFPFYYGACGRVIVEENSGKTLSAFYNAPFSERLSLAYQIFKIADMMTNNPTEFALYWTDIDYENIAVDNQGKVVIIDAENIIVVDKKKVEAEKPADWNKPLHSTFDTCKPYSNCLSFSPDDLCAHKMSDHNYYSVCRDLLSSYATTKWFRGGFLHSMPDYMRRLWGLEDLLNECAKPKRYINRFEVKKQLLHVFQILTNKTE